jgi:hypothetical protein
MPLSTFVRDYDRVMEDAAAQNDEVLLERRAGKPSFVLAPLRRVESDRHALSAVSQLLRHTLSDAAGARVLLDGVLEEFAWAVFLPTDERERFAIELVDTLRGCAALGRFTAFEDLVDSWQATAAIWSDPELAASLTVAVAGPDDRPVLPPAGD